MPHHLSQHTTPRTARGTSFHLLHSQCGRKSRSRARSGARHLWHVATAAVRFMIRLRRIVRTAPRLTQTEVDHLRKVYWEVSVANAFDDSTEVAAVTAANENLYSIEGITNFLQRFKEPHPPTSVQDLLAYVGYKAQDSANCGNSAKQANMLFSQLLMMFTYLKREQVARSKISDEEALFDTFVGDGEPDNIEGGESHATNGEAKIRSSPIEQALRSFDLKVLPPQLFRHTSTSTLHQQQPTENGSSRNPRLTMREFIQFLRQGAPNVVAVPSEVEGTSSSSPISSPTRGVSPVDNSAVLRGNPSVHFTGPEASSPLRDNNNNHASTGAFGVQSERHLSAAFSNVGALFKHRRQLSEAASVSPLSTGRMPLNGVGDNRLMHGGSMSFSGIDLLIEVEGAPCPSDELLDLQNRLNMVPRSVSDQSLRQRKYDALHRATTKAVLRKEWDKFDPSKANSPVQHHHHRPHGSTAHGTLTLVRRTATSPPVGSADLSSSVALHHNDAPSATRVPFKESTRAAALSQKARPHSALARSSSGTNALPSGTERKRDVRPQSAALHHNNSRTGGQTVSLSSIAPVDAAEPHHHYHQHHQPHYSTSTPQSIAQEVQQRIQQEEEQRRRKFLHRMVGTPSFELTPAQRKTVVSTYHQRCLQLNQKYEQQYLEEGGEVGTAQRVAAEALSAFHPNHHSNHSAAVNQLCATSEHSLLHIPAKAYTPQIGSYEVAMRSRPQSAASHRTTSFAQVGLPPPAPYELV